MKEGNISRQLDLEVYLPKEEFYTGEPVYLLVRLCNHSKKDLPITPLKVPSSDIAGNLGIVLSREDGVREFHPRYDGSETTSVSPSAELIPPLESGQSWFIVVELLSYFSENRELVSRPESRIEMGSGAYDLQAFYRWDFQPSLVVRSKTIKITVKSSSFFTRREKRKFSRVLRRLYSRFKEESPLDLCREIYSRGYGGGHRSGDLVRATLMESLEKNPIDTVGSLYIIEENQEGPPLFLYDLIMYMETIAEDKHRECRRFLDELMVRWPDGFIGEVAMQKKKFEEIAEYKTP
jgi:hypothetical protein